jgi:hypothetical protein
MTWFEEILVFVGGEVEEFSEILWKVGKFHEDHQIPFKLEQFPALLP